MLKMTGIRLELITDPKILNMLERHKRGGLCFVGSKRHAKANNRELPDYDDVKPSTYIQYYDVNNLYGHAMVQPLPFRGFRLDEIEEGRPVEGLLKMSTDREDDNDIGCILELDMFAPTEIHDALKELPPAPEGVSPGTRKH